MKTFIVIMFLTLYAVADIKKEFYHNGQLKILSHWNKGKKDGPFIIYYNNGYPKLESHFKDGHFHGVIKQYYINGQLKSIENIQNSEHYGHEKSYYKNGNLKSETIHEDDYHIGSQKLYYINGSLQMHLNFHNGVAVKGEYHHKSGRIEVMSDSFMSHYYKINRSKPKLPKQEKLYKGPTLIKSPCP